MFLPGFAKLLAVWSVVFFQGPPATERPQILWQRSLEDALSLAKAENRALLVAVNLDGESASDRIITERYRNPKFVAWTRPFVCIIAHPFRHNPKDYDENGMRIPCPRLGEITCGEHVALEPILFEKYLKKDRVSPRHTLIQPDGSKSFDLYYLFDMRELDKALEENFVKAQAPTPLPVIADRDWNALASGRDQKTRERLEKALLAAQSENELRDILAAIERSGDAGSIDALRVILLRQPRVSSAIVGQVAMTAEKLHLGSALESVVESRFVAAPQFPGASGLGDDRYLLRLLGSVEELKPSMRIQLLARLCLSNEADRIEIRQTLAKRMDAQELRSVEHEIETQGGAIQWDELMQQVDSQKPTALTDASKNPGDALPSADEAEKELEAADSEATKNPSNSRALARQGFASLNLARIRMESKGKDIQLLLQDAAQLLAQAAKSLPQDLKIGIERARTAYFLGQYDEQERIGWETFERAVSIQGLGDVEAAVRVGSNDQAVECLRWVGDAEARLLESRIRGNVSTRAGGILRGLRALSYVCVSSESAEIDWISLASYCRILGMAREELQVLQTGAARLPQAKALRDALNASLWNFGRIDLAPMKAEWISGKYPKDYACAWYAGYAWILAAENSRREERFQEAADNYRRASIRFEDALQLNPQSRDNTTHYLALCALGEGFASLSQDRQAAAMDQLLKALSLSLTVADVRDGLDHEAVDLLDGALEWRNERASPVGYAATLKQFESRKLPARWFVALSDTELREALRADGRIDSSRDFREADGYMENSIDAAQKAQSMQDDESTRHTLAQSLTVHAERLLGRNETERVPALLTQAAKCLSQEAPAEGSSLEVWKQHAAKLRELLGPARPIFRPGR